MWCQKRQCECINSSCSAMGKICDTWGTNDSLKSTREQQLEERIKVLEQENANLRMQLFNSRAAAPAYKQY